MASLRETSDEDKVRGKNVEAPKNNKFQNKNSKSKSSSTLNSLKDFANGTATEDVEDVANKGTEGMQKAGAGATKAVKNAPSNIKALMSAPQKLKESIQNMKKKIKERKRMKERIRRIIKIIRFILQMIIKLILAFWWVILIVAGFILLAYLAFSFVNNASVRGNQYIDAEVAQYNTVSPSDVSDLELTEVTMENKLVRAFYYYFAEKSVWVMTDGKIQSKDGITDGGVSTDGEVLQFRSQEYIDKFGDPDDEDAEVVKDKYGRESEFYINPNALYVLDKYLHDSKFRFPEQIVKHVAYEKNVDYTGGGTGVDFSGSENAQICWNFYRSMGFSEVQTAGLLGNIYAESSFDPTASNGTHFGIHQWGAGRYAALQELASSKNSTWTDLKIQLQYAYSELTGSYYKSKLDSNGWNDSNLTVSKAADLIRLHYEVCGEQAAEKRRNAAQEYYEKFKGTGGDNSSSTDNNTNADSSANISQAYATWKQFDSRWGNLPIGSDTVRNIGCFATSECVLAAYSGAASKDESIFNPLVGIPKLRFNGEALDQTSIVNLGDGSLSFHGEKSLDLQGIINEVKSNVNNGYFYIVWVNPTHFIPVVGVTDNDVLVNDVGRSGEVQTLSNYLATSGRTLQPNRNLRIFKSSKTNMAECGNVSYNGSNNAGGVNSIPYKLKQLTDDNGNLIVDSTKYKMEKVEEKIYTTETTEKEIILHGNTGKTEKNLKLKIKIDKDGNETVLKSGEAVFEADEERSPKGHIKYNQIIITEVDTGKTETKTYWVKTDEKEKGVWDYGFGSIVFYNQYEESQESRGTITDFDCWDPEKLTYDEDGNKIYGGLVHYTAETYDVEASSVKSRLVLPFDLSEIHTWGQSTSKTYLIKWAITPAGSITNSLKFEEVALGPDNNGETENTTLDNLEQWVQVPKTESVWLGVDPKKKDSISEEEKSNWSKAERENFNAANVYEAPKEVDRNGDTVNYQTLVNDTYKPIKQDYTYLVFEKRTVSKTFYGTPTGMKYSYQATYDNNNVDLSGISGTRYYKDYLNNYAGYVPISVQGSFDFDAIKERTGKNEEELEKVLSNSVFTNNTDTVTNSFFDEEGHYTGLGSIQTRYETGAEIGSANVGHYEHDGYNPGWGFANFTAENCTAFMKWLKEKDSDFYNKYFGGVTIDPNGGKDTPFYDAWQKAANMDLEQFTMYYISFSYKNDCYDNVLIKDKVKNNPVLAQIDFTRSFPLQEMVYSVGCAAPGIAIEVLNNCGITANDTDAEIITKMGKYMSTDEFCKNWYKPIYWNGVKNRWSPDKESSQTNILLKYIEDNGDVAGFEYDPDTELFTGDGVSSTTNKNNWFNSVKKVIKKTFKKFQNFVSDIIFGKEYTDVLEEKYWVKIQGGALADNQSDWVLSAMFAYDDQEKTTDYEIDDEYFKLKFQQLFSSEGVTGSGATVKDRYFSGKTTNPLANDKDAKIISKYNAKTDPVLQVSTKKDTEIKAVAAGQVLKVGYDAKYGGDYIMIQHNGCVSIYGHLANNTVQKKDNVKAGDVIGTSRTTFYFALRIKPKGNYINPTTIFKDDTSNSSGVVAPADANDIVKRAYENLGKPYVYGAYGPDSFDCSGLVGYCITGKYARKWTTTEIRTWEKTTDPQPGDICINSHHTGVYIGGGKMIHAPDIGDVVKIGNVQKDMWYVKAPS